MLSARPLALGCCGAAEGRPGPCRTRQERGGAHARARARACRCAGA